MYAQRDTESAARAQHAIEAFAIPSPSISNQGAVEKGIDLLPEDEIISNRFAVIHEVRACSPSLKMLNDS